MSDLPAGPELDAAVAERVMGLESAGDDLSLAMQATGPMPYYLHPSGIVTGLPHYSTDWAAAGQLAERLMAKGYQFTLTTYELGPEKWCAVFFGEHNQWEGFADTAPHAISLAAVEAAGESLQLAPPLRNH